MKKLRLNLTVKLMLVASLLLAIPFVGYYYVDDMEELLRKGQEQNLMGNARGLATALHERPNLFNKHASFLDKLTTGKDFFPTEINTAIKLDGKRDDWQNFITSENSNHYDGQNQIKKFAQVEFELLNPDSVSLSYETHIGRYKEFVYAFFKVTDERVIFRASNALSVTDNDHLEVATINQDNQLVRYVFSNFKPGWNSAYLMPNSSNKLAFPKPENRFQGVMHLTPDGYNLELRIAKDLVGEKFSFHISDVDSSTKPIKAVNIGTSSSETIESLGTFTVPSKTIENIITASKRTHSTIRVMDQHNRVLFKKGTLENATGEWLNEDISKKELSRFEQIKNILLEPLYKLYLVKPAKQFTTEDFANRKQQDYINNALQGTPDSHWWRSKDNKAVILSAAHPIYLDNKVKGVVIVEETTHAVRSIRNKAIEGIVITSALIAFSVIFLFIYSLWTSLKIRRLRNQVEAAVDDKGEISANITPFKSNDEIGDVSRSMHKIIGELGQYNDYLKNMSSRLSHELKTPISVVRSSLEMMENDNLADATKPYMQRAKNGINRLNSMLMAMSEASHLEQALQTSLLEKFDLAALVEGCSLSYQQIYQPQLFSVNIATQPLYIKGSDEHIAQLFDKLIANAVEFSLDKDAIVICLHSNSKNNSATLSVTNKGALLPEGMENNIFDAMVSLRSEEQKQQPHLGIGLYICRLISEFHNGELEAKNLDDNSGVEFTLTLPMK
ncbi:proteobacterial dedicated sortase system histidine kinase [Thalassomonas sp. M1454]|uniref:proteobacterial dedicated sortase system histidine kinase n=1 Tax=Thalassomonas sp. M1454 TaxID=2594477 RepID=UPI0011811562|nr:proteobacterial dedicated sortase system histidine kinase [Thalassomonas sp. M1454]TRX53849.1 proteobacterial dedicated sortase system histidine kinase [Thalassomonas sp. M1454]